MQIQSAFQKTKLIAKQVGKLVENSGVKNAPLNAKTFDEFHFTDKIGDTIQFRVYKDELGRGISKLRLNLRTKELLKRDIEHKTYTYENGKIANYREILTQKSNVSNGVSSHESKSRELISSFEGINGKKGVSKTKDIWYDIDPSTNTPLRHYTGISLHENKEKPLFYFYDMTRKPDTTIIHTNAYLVKEGKAQKLPADSFCRTFPMNTEDFRHDAFKMSLRAGHLEDYGITKAPQHWGFEGFDKTRAGAYIKDKKIYAYNVDHPIMKSRGFYTNNCAHELTHANQKREIEYLEKGLLSGERKMRAEAYKYEFDNYIIGPEEITAYRAQKIEQEAVDVGNNIEKFYNKNLVQIHQIFKGKLIPPQLGIDFPT